MLNLGVLEVLKLGGRLRGLSRSTSTETHATELQPQLHDFWTVLNNYI